MAEAARLAEADAGAGDLLHELDSVRVVNIISWPSKAPAHDLANALAVAPREALYTHIGGNTPQWLVNEAAQAIHAGDLKFVLIAGAEAMYSARRARAKGIDLGWSPRGNPAPDIGDPRPGVSEAEVEARRRHARARLSALRKRPPRPLRPLARRAPAGARRADGAVLRPSPRRTRTPGSATRSTAHQIATPGADNRYIGFPYPKYMNAIIDVDQGAALLLTSVGEARRLGIPEERWVYLWGCGDATDHWFVTERVNYHSSPAIRAAGARAMSMAGVTIDEIAHFDLYSCFPSAVQITRDMLGIAAGRPAAADGDRRAAVLRRPRQQLRHPQHRRDGREAAHRPRQHRPRHGQRLVRDEALHRHLLDAAAATRVEPHEPKGGPGHGRRRPAPAPSPPPLTATPRSRPTPCCSTARARPSVASSSAGWRPASASSPTPPSTARTLESMTKREMVGAKGRVSSGGDGSNTFVPA